MENNKADAVRIQTSILNGLEKEVLVWLAHRQPRWMTSDILTYIGSTSGHVKIIKDLDTNIEGKDVIIVEDILDSGATLSSLKEILLTRKPASVKICTFLDKPDRRKADIKADYAGATIPDEFVIGYGLDYDEKYRALPYVGVLRPEVYTHVE